MEKFYTRHNYLKIYRLPTFHFILLLAKTVKSLKQHKNKHNYRLLIRFTNYLETFTFYYVKS